MCSTTEQHCEQCCRETHLPYMLFPAKPVQGGSLVIVLTKCNITSSQESAFKPPPSKHNEKPSLAIHPEEDISVCSATYYTCAQAAAHLVSRRNNIARIVFEQHIPPDTLRRFPFSETSACRLFEQTVFNNDLAKLRWHISSPTTAILNNCFLQQHIQTDHSRNCSCSEIASCRLTVFNN